jgi:outer membrane protein assembly factor BamB
LRSSLAATGHKLWNTAIGIQSFYPSPPVAANGIVYVNGLGEGGTTAALDAATGRDLWDQFTFDGSDGTVAVGKSSSDLLEATSTSWMKPPAACAPLLTRAPPVARK